MSIEPSLVLLEIIENIEDLFISFQKGEQRGFDYFFHLYYKPLLYFANSILKDKEVAEDTVADSFVKLWEKRKTIRSASGVKPYLYMSVRNSCLNILRKQKCHGIPNNISHISGISGSYLK